MLGSKIQKGDAPHTFGPMIESPFVDGPFDEGFQIANIINDSGMSGTKGRNHTHSNKGTDMWKVTASEENKNISISLDLGEIVSLGEMHIWNYNGTDEDEKRDKITMDLRMFKFFFRRMMSVGMNGREVGIPFD